MNEESWDDYAEGWESNSDVIAYSENAFQSLVDVIDCRGIRVLDFGCGTGLLSEKLSRYAREVVAIDPSEKMISVLNRKQLSNVIAINAELTKNLIDENELFQSGFDLIVASSVLAFVPEYRSALLLLKSLLSEQGCLVQWDWLKENSDRGAGFTRDELKDSFGDIGFSDIQVMIPFAMKGENDSMSVVMGVGKNA